MDFKKQKPIYQQIADGLCERILQGEWTQGERMASIRDVATNLGVNPNTVQRAFDTLQDNSIIFNRRGVGYFVADNAKKNILSLYRQEFIHDELPAILQKMQMLGIGIDDLTALQQQLNLNQ